MGLIRSGKSETTDATDDKKAQAKATESATTLASNDADSTATTRTNSSTGKGVPTPTRKQAEAARMDRLHPVLSKKEQKARDREARAKKRDLQFRTVEARPERVLLRNHVDSRWSITEFAWPVILILLAAVLASQWSIWIALVSQIGIWVYFLACAIDVALRWRSYKKEAAERIPGFNPKGQNLLSYMMSRMITMRRFRNPGPVVKRGEEY